MSMTSLLEKAWERIGSLPPEEQDAIASEILAAVEDEEGWRRRFSEKHDVIQRMADQALEQDARGETVPLESIL